MEKEVYGKQMALLIYGRTTNYNKDIRKGRIILKNDKKNNYEVTFKEVDSHVPRG